jgi:penicillin-binding protein 1C
VAPNSPVPDLPRRFGGYAPENFDRGFAGSVTAGEALRRSLNLPAVALLDRVGPLRFAATLRAAGAALRLPRGADPSLPLALGGAGITLRQAASLYAALATDGTGGALRLLADQPATRPEFLSAAAAHLVADVLTRPLPGFGAHDVAWKTGTSWGGRDVWALGFDARHVVAVWIGRPDGTPLPDATGISLALPQLGRVFDLLPKAPRTLTTVEQQPTRTATPVADALHLLFPPSGAVLSADGPVTIRVMGGRRPLTFLIDGAPLPTDRIRRDVAWLPSGPGFYRLTVLDADGAAVRAGVQVRIKP